MVLVTFTKQNVMEEKNLRFNLPKDNTSPIKVIGVGGGGSNAVDYMFAEGIAGVDFIICNTDSQALDKSEVPIKIQLGTTLTKGRGAGAIPEVGKNAAVETLDEIENLFTEETTMVFITAGMGGGTGTGAAPIIARAAKERGILTVGIVTVPFGFEGRKRNQQAQGGLKDMRDAVDTLLIIKNEKLRELYGNLSLKKAFGHADEVLLTAAKGIAEVITLTGEINVDMNDVNTVMKESGVAIMGSGIASGEGRAIKAVQEALESPLLNDNDIHGANFILLNITYGSDEILMDEISNITDYVQEAAGQTAEVIWGYGQDETLEDKVCVTIIATGFEAHSVDAGIPAPAEEKKVLNLEQDSLKFNAQEITAPVTKPTDTPRVTFPPTNDGQVDVTVPKEEEPFIISKPVEPVVTPQETPLEKTFADLNKESVQKLPFQLQDDFTPNPPEANTPVENVKSPEVTFTTPEPIEKLELPVENDKKVFSLDDDELDKQKLPSIETTSSMHTGSTVNIVNAAPIEEDRPSKEILQVKNRERQMNIRELTAKLKTPSGLKELEDEPAYMRVGINLDSTPHSSQNTTSQFSVGKKGTDRLSNNTFLHDNVD